MLNHTPSFDSTAASRLARELYGVDANAVALPSERDQNFLLIPASGEGMVLKIANALESAAMIAAQQRALQHLATRLMLTPIVVVTTSGETVTETTAADGRPHQLWAITHLPGVPLGTVRRRTPALLHHLGASIGALTLALRDFDDPALHRDFCWDLANGRRVIDAYRLQVEDAGTRAAIAALVGRTADRLDPLLSSL
ncbi:MAG: phosphotransferase, partial [Gemmatimonadota bacterium]|nr:phosphotransferase [Gemmatimonadota bacterium]